MTIPKKKCDLCKKEFEPYGRKIIVKSVLFQIEQVKEAYHVECYEKIKRKFEFEP